MQALRLLVKVLDHSDSHQQGRVAGGESVTRCFLGAGGGARPEQVVALSAYDLVCGHEIDAVPCPAGYLRVVGEEGGHGEAESELAVLREGPAAYVDLLVNAGQHGRGGLAVELFVGREGGRGDAVCHAYG